jgi:hypothetical protein
MKRCFSRYRLALFAMSLISFTATADQVWKGTFGPDNVIDENLVIKGDVLLRLGATTIRAINKDVTVTLTENATVSGHWAGESQLYLVASEGRTIRFITDHNLTFIGSSQITGDNLLIVQSGPGTVEVALAEGKQFALTSQEGSGGVSYYVLMYGGVDAPCEEYTCDEYCIPCCIDEYTGLPCEEYGEEYSTTGTGCNETSVFRPTLRFINLEMFPRSSHQDRRITVGGKSILSFLSSRLVGIAQDAGYISFDPVMTGCGRMILQVEDTGAFITSGTYTCQRNGELITSTNIKPAVAAGYQAIWTTTNSFGPDMAAGLLVLDSNQTLSDLLVDPFLNLYARQDNVGFRGLFSGQRFGVILGANGILNIQSESYVDFVGLALNRLPFVVVPGFETSQTSKLLKLRNPSAFIIDGNLNPAAIDAQIIFGEQAALFLRSGIADNGMIRFEDDVDPFTIDASSRTCGVGNIVFDVEGELDVTGVLDMDGNVTSEIELLSLEVIPSGGSLFVGSGETNFPSRTFNTEDDALLMYNSGAFLINNRMNLYTTALSHTDEGHTVCANNDLRSEPAYIGGETFRLLDSAIRPSMRFINSNLNVNTDIALTGLDLVVPNYVDEFGILHANLSDFIFYSNGACVDNGTGRQMILGTRIGSTAANGCSRIDADAYLDVMEQDDAIGSDLDPTDPNGNQTLDLSSAFNDASINPLAETNVNSIHTIFLGGSSNISVGVNADSTGFNIDTNPWLRIAGNVFSFEAKGGAATVARSVITGKNAIFVDLNGEFSIEPGFITDIDVMVIKSHNGIVDLPADQVFFTKGAAVATWNVDLSNPEDQIIVGPGQELPTYVFNWIRAKKDCPNFVPFSCCVDACVCSTVTEANITGLPTIQGNINDLQIQGTRIGDPAQFLIDGGNVNQLTFVSSSCSGEVPVATIVLQNDGTVGLDSTTTLGTNGVIIIANGSGQVNVNSDLIINNTCAFVKGPDFASCDVLQLYSAVPHQILLKSGATLNLTSFTDPSEIVAIAGQLTLAVEPGAQIVTGAGTLRFADSAQLLFIPANNATDFFNAIPFGAEDSTLPITIVPAADPHNPLSSLINFGEGLHNTDQFRVKIIGGGTIEIVDNAQGSVPFNAFVGIETINTPLCDVSVTDITLSLADNGTFAIGHFNANQGGVVQIGNIDPIAGHSVSFNLVIDGADANFSIGSHGFLGLGVGIQRFDGMLPLLRARNCPTNFVPNENIVSTLSNLGTITFDFLNGRFEHDRIFSGDNMNASLLAVGNVSGLTFDLNFAAPDENVEPEAIDQSNFTVAGGANIVLVSPGEVGGLQPIVLDQNGELSLLLTAGIMASTLLQPDNVDVAGLTATQFFDYIATQDATDGSTTRDNTFGRANAASQGDSFRPESQDIRVDTVGGDTIIRTSVFDILGVGQEDSKNRAAIDAAAVFVDIDPTINEIVAVTNIQAGQL